MFTTFATRRTALLLSSAIVSVAALFIMLAPTSAWAAYYRGAFHVEDAGFASSVFVLTEDALVAQKGTDSSTPSCYQVGKSSSLAANICKGYKAADGTVGTGTFVKRAGANARVFTGSGWSGKAKYGAFSAAAAVAIRASVGTNCTKTSVQVNVYVNGTKKTLTIKNNKSYNTYSTGIPARTGSGAVNYIQFYYSRPSGCNLYIDRGGIEHLN